ncbi:MAG TPA: exodeoxyribonuclease V subunit alpha, partial [Dermatophilaceae bacterium]|nr:exodeoxyribonuclease V subunit alpha [Dermatophilaceae bacterium]
NELGVLESSDVQVAARLGALGGEPDQRVLLAVALAVKALRGGSVCLDLSAVADATPEATGVGWPDPSEWLAAVQASPLVAASVLHLEGPLLYLDRYWREEGLIAARLRERVTAAPPPVDEAVLLAGAQRIFPEGYAEQRAVSVAAARRWTALITGGPGTGKTTAVAGLIALLAEQAAATGATRPLRVALTAPTGKAAARLQEAVAAAAARLPGDDRARLAALPTTAASTLHRLLGSRPGTRTRFRHDRDNRLPHDVVVVDETSMVSLTMMARLVEALRPDARLVLVGDPDQLSSVEAGAVLADLVAGYAALDPDAVGALRTSHRFGAQIGALAVAVRDGDADAALAVLLAGGAEVTRLDPADPLAVAEVREVALGAALELRRAAAAGDPAAAIAALDRHRLLCAHRDGPVGAGHWNRQVERWLTETSGVPVGAAWGREWYAGRPLLVTANDYGLGLFNGDTGVAIAADPGRPRRSGRGRARPDAPALRAAVATAGEPTLLATSRLADVETMHALTIHKSQGGQADEVTVVLPDEDSHLLTRELLYTAITRAQSRVRILGSEEALRLSIGRPAQRASGLRARLAEEGGAAR